MRFLLVFIFILFASFVFSQKTANHKVKKGETFYGIARQYEVSVGDIYKLNPKLKGKNLQVNQLLKVPDNTINKKQNVIETPTTHIVERGDTFYKISKKYNLNVVDIVAYNKNLESSNLKVGEIIYLKEMGLPNAVPVNTTSIDETGQEEELTHVVLSKETKYGISKKYGISIAELERLNPDIISGLLVGITLVIKPATNVDVVASVPTDEDTEIDSDETAQPLSYNNLDKANYLIEKSSAYIGTRYRSGGTSSSGFDCSGLMCTTFKEIYIDLPRTSRDQSNTGKKVKRKHAQVGDLIFFSTNGRGNINHVGMVTEVTDDEIKFIHASSSAGVIISSLNENYYSKRFKQINRVLE